MTKTIVKMIFGSHLYGTSTENSDTDYKGIFIPDRDDVLLGRIPKSINLSTGSDKDKNSSDDVDEEMYSLHYFIKMACEGQTVAIDMLHAPKSALISSSEIWEELQQKRSQFYTSNLKSLVGYARKQAAKYGIKGSRLSDARKVLAFFKSCEPSTRLRDVWNKLPEGEHIKKTSPEEGNRPEWVYEVCGRKFIATSRIEHYLPTLETFVERYGERAKLAESGKGVDWKAVSHAFRAAHQVRSILQDGGFEYPLTESEFLLKVKSGGLHYPTVARQLEELIDEVEKLSANSSLPDKVNRKQWDIWLINKLEKELLKK